MFNHPNFFVSDVAEYAQNIGAQADGKKVMAFFPSWTPRTGKCAICSLPWRRWHRHPPARRRPPTFRYRLTSLARPTPSSASPRTRKAARPTALPKQNQDAAELLAQRLEPAVVHRPGRPPVLCCRSSARTPIATCPLKTPASNGRNAMRRSRPCAHPFRRRTLTPQRQNLACDNLSFNPWHGDRRAPADWGHQSAAQGRV
jgi:hypothetical protein